MTDLVKGGYYSTLSYGMVEYKNSITHKNDNGSDYIVHKFMTARGVVKYILAEELETFLRKEDV